MKRGTLFLGILAALSSPACSSTSDDSTVVVAVTAAPGMPPVTQLQVALANGPAADTRFFPQSQSATPVQFPAIFALALSKSHTGVLGISIAALDTASTVVAVGSGTVAIVPGGRADVTISLGLVAVGDASVADTSAGEAGGGHPDVAAPEVVGLRDTNGPDSPQGSDSPGLGGSGGSGGVDAAAGADAAVGTDAGADEDVLVGAGGAGGGIGGAGGLAGGGEDGGSATGGAGGVASGGAGGGTGGGAGGGTGGSTTPDAPAAASCGNGIVESPEQCDDTNNIPGDGCSELCTIELGFKCSGSPSVCTPATCGDGVVEGNERCDDGNTMPFDGCSMDCQFEPDCSGASCISKCGDGIVVGEECDDGNVIDGDGCSSSCTIETGWKCSQPPMGTRMLVPAVYRDFKYHNPSDFQAGVTGSTAASAGVVEAALDSEGKPVFTGLTGTAIHIESKSTFAMWYRNTAGVNHATSSKLALWDNGSGAYVNRYGATGERWNITQPAYFCGTVGYELLDSGGAPIPCTMQYQGATLSTDCTTLAANGYEMAPGSCKASAGSYSAQYIVSKVDGNPLFFPVDGDNFTPATEFEDAKIPPAYDASGGWPYDVDAAGNKRLHNFSFTSEIRYYFKYEAGKAFQVDINGDDDVWVFVNKKLAVDLGGVHMPVEGSVTLDASSATKFGLTDGKVYEIAVFQAERQTNSSTFKITLGGFNTAPSTCTPQ